MPASPLAAALIGQQDAGLLGTDPAVLEAMPQINLAQALMKQGIDTSGASPLQALARVAQAAAGQSVMSDATKSLASAYANSADSMAKTLEQVSPGHPLIAALRSPDLSTRMAAAKEYGKALTLLGEPYSIEPKAERQVAGRVVGKSGEPQTEEGALRRDQLQAAGRGDVSGAAAIGSSLTGKTVTPEGVTRPPVPLPGSMFGPNETVVGMGPGGGKPANVGAVTPGGKSGESIAPGASLGAPGAPTAGPAASPASFDQRFGAAGLPGQIATAKAGIGGAEAAMKDFVDKSTPAYDSAQSLKGRLDIIDHNIDTLGPSWMGAGANTKGEVAKSWNGLLDSAGVKGFHFDPQKIGSWEDFNKETIRAGMELIKSNFGGSREAASIIQMGNTAVPSVGNTYLGAKYVSATIRAAAQREIDLHEYKAELAQSNKPLLGAEVAFNRAHPPQDYAFGAITSQIPAPAKKMLMSDPKLLEHFDRQFGPGTGEFILKSGQGQ